MPQALSETTDVEAAINMNDHQDYGLHSLDNLKPISPAALDGNSANTMSMKSEDETKDNKKYTELDPEKPLNAIDGKTLENSDVDWNQALALINDIPDTPYASNSIEINKSDSIKAISAHESKDSKVSNVRTEYSDADNMKEASQSSMLNGNNDEFDTSNSIVKMKESHSRFAAFLKKGRHSP